MRASDQAYRALRDEIIDGQLPPGAVLAEVEQAARLGISRTPLREALSRLTAAGLVAPQSGRGLVVTPLELDDIHRLFELRTALELQASRLAARRGEPGVFADLQAEFQAVAELLADADPARNRYYDLVDRFDEAIAAAVDNAYLAAALASLRTHLVRVRRLAHGDTGRLLAAAAEHGLIAEAIALGDADLAADATRIHHHRSLTNIQAIIRARDEASPVSQTDTAPTDRKDRR